MDDIKFKEEIKSNAIKFINKNNTFLRNWFNYFKYLLGLIGIRNLWCKKIFFDTVKIRYNNKLYQCTPMEIVIKDDCLLINDVPTPYEYIVNIKRFSVENYTLYTFDILGTVTFVDNGMKIKLGGEHVKLLLYTNSKYNIIKTIRNNMYYHIFYNKINDQVIIDLNKKNN